MPQKTKALRSWKNFVLKFRKEFDANLRADVQDSSPPARQKNRASSEPEEFISLSLLLFAVAASRSMPVLPGIAALNSQHELNPKYKNPAIDFEFASDYSRKLNSDLKQVTPQLSQFLLADHSSNYKEQFSKILKTVEVSEIAACPFIFGYTYQYWRDCDRKNAQSEIQSADKQIDRDRLVAFTQIYTPDWVVDFIIANSILPQVDVSLASQSRLNQWLVPNFLEQECIEEVAEISIIDPAAGAGNFLLGAFELLLELHLLSGSTLDQAVNIILAKQLHGCDIDPLALSVAALAIVARIQQLGIKQPPQLTGLSLSTPSKDAILGSLSDDFQQTHPLARQHHAVVTNPPYIGRKLISRQLKTLLKSRFPDSHQDMSAAFFERSLDLLRPGGRVGLITQASMLSLPSHAKLRQLILDSYNLKTAVDAGPGVFPLQSGEKVNSAIIIVEKPRSQASTNTTIDTSIKTASFFNLKTAEKKRESLLIQISNLRRDHLAGSENETATALYDKPINLDVGIFRQFYGNAFNYDIPKAVATLLEKSAHLESIADIRQGLATTDNDRFVKFIWQVMPEEIGERWFPYVKGAGGQRYSSPIRHLVNWHNNGADIKAAVANRYPYLKGNTAWVVKNESFYFKRGLCFSFVNTHGIAVRRLPPNCIFDVGASAIFTGTEDFLLAYLNSSFMVALADSLNPTINNQVGDVKRFPILPFDQAIQDSLSMLGADCVDIKEQLDSLIDPSSWYSALLSEDVINRRPVSHPFYNTVDSSSREDSFQLFESLVRKLILNLNQKQVQINDIVLQSIARHERWTHATLAEVERWIGRCKSALTPAFPATKELFENNMLVHSLVCSETIDQTIGMFDASADCPELKQLQHRIRRQQPQSEEYRNGFLTESGFNLQRGNSSAGSLESFQSHIEKYFMGFPPEPLRSFSLEGIVWLTETSQA